jgi:hypothetical protein
MGPRGENARKVVRTEHVGYLFSVHWSPNGKRLAYERADEVMGLLWRYSIESCDLNGAKPSLIVSGKSTVDPGASLDFTFPEDFWWLPGHIIYSVTDTQQNSRSTQLYSVAVDEARGTPRGRPKRIGHLPFHIQAFSGTAEGTTLASETSADQGHILIGRLSPDGKLADVRPLTHLERFEAPFAWTSDSRFVIFNSDRAGGTGIYKQAPDQSAPELLYPERPLLERVSPDGGSLIYETVSLNEPRAYSLMRLSFAGHPPQLLLRNPDRSLSFDCPHRAGVWCLGSDRTSGQQESFFAFDPASGKRNHLFDVTWPPSRTEWLHWTVSPDGSHIGMVGDDPQSRIEIRSLAGVIEKRIESKDWPNPLSLDWAADGKSVFISHVGLMDSPSGPIGATIVRLYLDGRVQPIWDTRGGHTTWVIASPDGKYLAIREPVTQRNAWMIEDF